MLPCHGEIKLINRTHIVCLSVVAGVLPRDPLIALWCDRRRQWSMKERQQEPTKLLLLPGEVSTHPTDPVEMRRLHFQTPGMSSGVSVAVRRTDGL